jgi:putative hydrolase of the HAD superfamily
MTKGVIFDLGGTLIYSNHDHFEEANAWMLANFLRSRGYSLDPETFVQTLLHLRQTLSKGDSDLRQMNTTTEVIQQVAKEYAIELTGEFLFQCEKVFITPEAQSSMLLPYIRKVISYLAPSYRLAVVSNTRSHVLVTETLKHVGLTQFFNPIVTSVSAGFRKPSPKVFMVVLEQWGLPASDIVMVGNSIHNDMEGAKALGMKTMFLALDSSDVATRDVDIVLQTPNDIQQHL